MTTLLDLFSRIHSLSAADYKLLLRNVRRKSVRKGTHLVVPGQVWRELYFVESGVQMAHYDYSPQQHSATLGEFRRGFLNSRAVTLPACGHFSQEEQPTAVFRALQEFLAAT